MSPLPVAQGPYIDEPAGNTAYGLLDPNPKSSAVTDYFGKCRFHVLQMDQSAPHNTFLINYDNPGSFQHGFNVPTPATNPRTPSAQASFGGNTPQTPTTNHGSWAITKILIWEALLPTPELAAAADSIIAGQTNNGAFHEGGPQATGAGP